MKNVSLSLLVVVAASMVTLVLYTKFTKTRTLRQGNSREQYCMGVSQGNMEEFQRCMSVPGSNIPNEASVRCDDGTGMIYRFENGTLRYYPSPAIAASWNPSWNKNIVNITKAECDAIPKGNPMDMKVAPTQTPTPPPAAASTSKAWAGQTIALRGGKNKKFCGANDKTKNVACDRDNVTPFELFQVDQQSTNRFSLKNVATQKFCHDMGDQVRCHSDQPREHEMYEISDQGDGKIAILGPKSGNKRLWCSDEGSRVICNRPKIGDWEIFSWLSSSNVKIDKPFIPEGASVTCGDGMVYRFEKGVLRYYPSPQIALTWNPTWDKDIITLTSQVCESIPKGEPMTPNLPTIQEGASVRCGNGKDIYRFEKGVLRLYPNPATAGTWNPTWNQNIVSLSESQCQFIPKGEPMTPNIPAVQEGASVRCGNGKAIYRFENGVLRLYPNPAVAAIWNPTWDQNIVGLSEDHCQFIAKGEPMVDIREGASVTCGDGMVYRFENRTLRYYPSPDIAASWNPSWDKDIISLNSAQCQVFAKGEPMTPKLPEIQEGASVTCGDGMVYRFENQTLRYYPSPDIAASWNPSWDKDIIALNSAQCQILTKGDPMALAVDPEEIDTSIQPSSSTLPSPETINNEPDTATATSSSPTTNTTTTTMSSSSSTSTESSTTSPASQEQEDSIVLPIVIAFTLAIGVYVLRRMKKP